MQVFENKPTAKTRRSASVDWPVTCFNHRGGHQPTEHPPLKPMPDTCLYFQVHQPNRLLHCGPARRGQSLSHEDDAMNAAILGRVAERCYLPANRMFKRLIEKHSGRFRMALSISGTAIEQMQRHRPDVLESFQDLVAGGGVELLAETYYHSLAFIHSNKEFDRQVDLHLEKLEEVFQVRPRVFRNTELIYNDAIAAKARVVPPTAAAIATKVAVPFGIKATSVDNPVAALNSADANFPIRLTALTAPSWNS